MNLIFCLLLSVIVVQGYEESCRKSEELQSVCGNYCFKTIKPVLDHTKNMQSEVHELKQQSEYLAKLEKTEKMIEARLDLQDMKIERKLDDLRQLIESKHNRRPFERIGAKFYYIERSENVTWFGALYICRTLGANLVNIKNDDEFNAIVTKLQPEMHYWIDFNDLDVEGEFRSMSTGLEPTYFNWYNGNPDNWDNVENCGLIWYRDNKHLMNDFYCHSTNLFICEPENQ